jgi:hypothetical protein
MISPNLVAPTAYRLSLAKPVTGGVAQLGEHLLCKQGVIGSIPFTSTRVGDEGLNQRVCSSVG